LTTATPIIALLLLFWGSGCAPALHALAVEPAAVDVRASFFDSGGRRIRVDVYTPERPPTPGLARANGGYPAVVVVHGSSGVHKIVSSTASRYARALAEQGMIAFVVHYFDVTGTFTANLTEESDNFEIWAQVLRDAVTWVGRRPEVDADNVGLLGHSLGAFLAVGVAASDTRVSRVVLFGGGLEPFLSETIQRMPPTLVFHGDKDKEVPLSDAKDLVDFLRGRHCEVELRVLPGQGHTFTEPDITQVLTETARFFMPALRGEEAP
jgi:carboxymethylenebutenolidase